MLAHLAARPKIRYQVSVNDSGGASNRTQSELENFLQHESFFRHRGIRIDNESVCSKLVNAYDIVEADDFQVTFV